MLFKKWKLLLKMSYQTAVLFPSLKKKFIWNTNYMIYVWVNYHFGFKKKIIFVILIFEMHIHTTFIFKFINELGFSSML